MHEQPGGLWRCPCGAVLAVRNERGRWPVSESAWVPELQTGSMLPVICTACHRRHEWHWQNDERPGG